MKLSRSTNNFNEKSGSEFRGKSDISCYVQSNAFHPWITVDAQLQERRTTAKGLCAERVGHIVAILILNENYNQKVC